MELAEIKSSIKKGEGTHVEFKRKVDYPEKIAKEVIAFGNSGGGKLFIGVNDDGNISGLKNPEGDLFLLKNYIDENIRPKLHYDFGEIKISEKKGILFFDIPSSEKKPHYIKDPETGAKKSYIRLNDQSIKASREMKMILSRSRNKSGVKIYYDEYVSKILAHLNSVDSVTINQTKDFLQIPKRKASGILVKLTLAGLIRIDPGPGEDQFSKIS